MKLSPTLVFAAVLFAPAAAGATDLTSGEIRQEIVGRDIVWWETDGWHQGSLHLAEDGSAEIAVEHPGRSGDAGVWHIENDRLCTEWGSIRGGGEKCYRVRRDGAGRYVTSGGNVFEIREIGA